METKQTGPAAWQQKQVTTGPAKVGFGSTLWPVTTKIENSSKVLCKVTSLCSCMPCICGVRVCVCGQHKELWGATQETQSPTCEIIFLKFGKKFANARAPAEF